MLPSAPSTAAAAPGGGKSAVVHLLREDPACNSAANG
jgi:hypothetical protein